MLVVLTEVKENSRSSRRGSAERTKVYTLREVSVNPSHVVCLREDDSMKRQLQEGLLPPDLDDRQRFTRVFMERGQSGIDLIVVGSPDQIRHKIYENASQGRELLKG
jgi:hypothetical protein